MIPLSITLLLTALLHEDVAILAASVFVFRHDMSLALAFAVIYAGTLLNNYLIYAIGASARRLPRVRRWLIGPRVERVRRHLKDHLAKTLMLCRFVPWSLSATMLGCGWMGVPFRRYAIAIATTAALYVAAVGALVYMFGEVILRDSHWGLWIALIALVVIAVFVFYRIRDWRATRK